MANIKNIIITTMDEHAPMNFDELYHATNNRTGQNRTQFSKRMTALKAQGLIYRTPAQRFALTEEGEQAVKAINQPGTLRKKSKVKLAKIEATTGSPNEPALPAVTPAPESSRLLDAIGMRQTKSDKPPVIYTPETETAANSPHGSHHAILNDIIVMAQHNIDGIACSELDLDELARDLISIRNAAQKLQNKQPSEAA